MSWSRRLSREIVTKQGKRLRTLSDARAYMLALDGRVGRQYWQHAAALLLEAATGAGDVETATDQIVLALLHDGALDPGRTPAKR